MPEIKKKNYRKPAVKKIKLDAKTAVLVWTFPKEHSAYGVYPPQKRYFPLSVV